MSSNIKSVLKTLLTPNAGSCGCGRSKLGNVYEPKPKPKSKPQNPKLSSFSFSSSYSIDHDSTTSNDLSLSNNNIDTTLTATTSSTTTTTVHSELSDPDLPMVSPCPKIVDSVAVVKDSVDPYRDFRQSMMQMIMEREIYSRDELADLLQCFLNLNSPSHHHVIVKAFMEIWAAIEDEKKKKHEHEHGSSSS